MARATTVANGVTNDVIAPPRLEVLVSDLVHILPQSHDLLLLTVLTSISRPLVLTASPKSTRETLSDARLIVLITAFELIAIASLVTIGVTSVLDVRLISVPPLIAKHAPSPVMMNWTSTRTLTSMETSRVLRTTLG